MQTLLMLQKRKGMVLNLRRQLPAVPAGTGCCLGHQVPVTGGCCTLAVTDMWSRQDRGNRMDTLQCSYRKGRSHHQGQAPARGREITAIRPGRPDQKELHRALLSQRGPFSQDGSPEGRRAGRPKGPAGLQLTLLCFFGAPTLVCNVVSKLLLKHIFHYNIFFKKKVRKVGQG